MTTATRQAGYTREQLAELERLEDQMLGRLTFDDADVAQDELELEIGIPRPAWFAAQLPTITDVAETARALRRS